MKTFNKKDIITILNLEDAEKYVGEEGYFSDRCYAELGLWEHGVLAEVLKEETLESVFHAEDEDGDEINYFGLFIPAAKLKEVKSKSKFRPFADLTEFERVTGYELGDVVSLMLTKYNVIYKGVYTSSSEEQDGDQDCFITIGIHLLSLNNKEELKGLKIRFKGETEWRPFGVEVEE